MLQYTPYMLATLLSSIVILVVGVCLFVISIPRDPELRNYRIARQFLAGAYIILGAIGQWEVLGNIESEDRLPVMGFTLIVAPFQALLYTFSIVTLIRMQYVTARRLWSNMLPISLSSAVLLIILFLFPKHFYPVFYTGLACYCLQLVYYITLFRGEYKKYRHKLDDFFAGNEYRRLLWIKTSFYMATSIGVMAIVSLFVSTNVYIIFTIVYTVFYVYFATKFINYITLFHRIAPVVSDNKEEQEEPVNTAIHTGLCQWIEQKGYLDANITLDVLARELNTNTKYLSQHINSTYKQNFRSWINSLRIKESMRLIETCSHLALEDIPERTGIQSRSTFYRQFYIITGMTPAEYRRTLRG